MVSVGLSKTREQDRNDHGNAKRGESRVGPVENVPAHALFVVALAKEGAVEVVGAVLDINVEIAKIDRWGGHRIAAGCVGPEDRRRHHLLFLCAA